MSTAPISTLTTRQITILLLSYAGPVTIRAVFDAMHRTVDKGALSRGAVILEDMGLLQRRPEEGLPTSIVLVITAQGRKAVDRLAGL